MFVWLFLSPFDVVAGQLLFQSAAVLEAIGSQNHPAQSDEPFVERTAGFLVESATAWREPEENTGQPSSFTYCATFSLYFS